VLPGSSIIYTLLYTNVGNVTADNVVVTNTLPVSVTFSSSFPDPSGGPSQGTITYTIGTLAATSSGSIIIVAMVDASLTPGTVLTNTAGINTTTAETSVLNNTSILTTMVTSQEMRISDFGFPISDWQSSNRSASRLWWAWLKEIARFWRR